MKKVTKNKEDNDLKITVKGISKFIRKTEGGRYRWVALDTDFFTHNRYSKLSFSEKAFYLMLILEVAKDFNDKPKDVVKQALMCDQCDIVVTQNVLSYNMGRTRQLHATWVKHLESLGFVSYITLHNSTLQDITGSNSFLVEESKQGRTVKKKEEEKKEEEKKEESTKLDSPHKKDAEEVVEYLNLKCGKKFRNTQGSLKHIKARLNEGFSVDDCKQVIDNKHTDWSEDSKMSEYLRPETLFSSSKFEGYLNSGSTKVDDSQWQKEMLALFQECGATPIAVVEKSNV